MLLFFFLTFIVMAFLVLSFTSNILMAITSFFKNLYRRFTGKKSENQNTERVKIHFYKKEKKETSKKIFSDSDGEYVDYEEVK